MLQRSNPQKVGGSRRKKYSHRSFSLSSNNGSDLCRASASAPRTGAYSETSASALEWPHIPQVLLSAKSIPSASRNGKAPVTPGARRPASSLYRHLRQRFSLSIEAGLCRTVPPPPKIRPIRPTLHGRRFACRGWIDLAGALRPQTPTPRSHAGARELGNRKRRRHSPYGCRQERP